MWVKRILVILTFSTLAFIWIYLRSDSKIEQDYTEKYNSRQVKQIFRTNCDRVLKDKIENNVEPINTGDVLDFDSYNLENFKWTCVQYNK